MYHTLVAVQIFSILLLFAESIFIYVHWRTKLHETLFFSCVVILVSNVGYLQEMLSRSAEEFIVGVKFSYFGRSWIPFALLLMSLRICNIKMPKVLAAILVFIHANTFVLVFTNEYQNLYYTTATYVEDGLFPVVSYGHGIWYNGYVVLMGIYIIVGLSAMFRAAYREKNRLVKTRLILVSASVTVESLSYVLYMAHITGCYDATNMGYAIATVIMCIALFRFDLMDTLELAKESVLDDIPEGIFVYDQNSRQKYVNGVGMGLFPVELSAQEVRDRIETAIEAKEPIRIGGSIFSPEKKVLQYKGSDQGAVYMLVDSTKNYRYMDELQKQKELAETAREEAVAASESKSAFLSIVSHEIRTPMNAVVGMTDLLLREPEKLTGRQRKYLRNIKNSGSALVMIVNDLLDQSKIEAGKMEIVEEAYELRPMIDDVKMIIENRIGSKPIDLQIAIAEDIPQYLIGDSLRIRQILINLMNNAVKFTEEGFIRLTIHYEENGERNERIRFSVKDSGQGIKPEDLSRLGEAFAQVNTKINHGKEGTGLGISISKDFIDLMGGKLEVTSVYGEGSEFFFVIEQRATEGIEKDAATGLKKQAWQETENFTCSGARILAVDDTEVNLLILEELLQPLKMTIDTASTGQQAIQMIQDNRYDLVLMDYMMPYMDGVRTTEKIRKLAEEALQSGDEDKASYYRTVPIIALSGDDSASAKDSFATAGMNDFTEKPVDLKRIKKLLLKWLPENLIEAQ